MFSKSWSWVPDFCLILQTLFPAPLSSSIALGGGHRMPATWILCSGKNLAVQVGMVIGSCWSGRCRVKSTSFFPMTLFGIFLLYVVSSDLKLSKWFFGGSFTHGWGLRRCSETALPLGFGSCSASNSCGRCAPHPIRCWTALWALKQNTQDPSRCVEQV